MQFQTNSSAAFLRCQRACVSLCVKGSTSEDRAHLHTRAMRRKLLVAEIFLTMTKRDILYTNQLLISILVFACAIKQWYTHSSERCGKSTPLKM